MIDFYFDYASPWAYLASELLSARFPTGQVVYRPIYLRGLESFASGIPYSPAKLRYLMQDLQRCAAYHGIAIRQPTQFPINGLYAVRGALAAQAGGQLPAYHRAMFHAAWRDDRDISDKQVVIALAGQLGLDLARTIDAPALKEQLKADTAAAVERGLFGVPTFFVGDQMFWGHDRLDYVARALHG